MSNNKEKLFTEFTAPTTQEWLDKIQVDLKGADFEKKLVWRTNEGFSVQPFYRREDVLKLKTPDALPGEFPFVRGNKKDNNEWYVRQNIAVEDAKEAPYCYKEYELLDNGPLRFSVALTYHPTTYKQDTQVVEHRILSLDKGSNFNKMTVWYEGLTQPAQVASGIVVHSEDTKSLVLGKKYVNYADPTDNPEKQNFRIFVAALFPQGVDATRYVPFEKPFNGNAGHALGIINNYQNGTKFTYYFGSAWSKYDCRSQQEWQCRIDSYLQSLSYPLEIRF